MPEAAPNGPLSGLRVLVIVGYGYASFTIPRTEALWLLFSLTCFRPFRLNDLPHPRSAALDGARQPTCRRRRCFGAPRRALGRKLRRKLRRKLGRKPTCAICR